MTCFVSGCVQRLVVTRAWRDGPTLHACREHEPKLPESRAEAEGRKPRQGVLL